MMLRLFNTCRRDLSQMASFTFTGPRFTINQPPGSPRHRTSLFDKPKIELFAARIYWISSTNLEAIWTQLQYDYWSLDPRQLFGVVAASCTSLTLFYAVAWLWGTTFDHSKYIQSRTWFWQVTANLYSRLPWRCCLWSGGANYLLLC